jgi:hypothetical protein
MAESKELLEVFKSINEKLGILVEDVESKKIHIPEGKLPIDYDGTINF